VVATNQSGSARGLMDMASLNAINSKMHKAVNQAGGRIEAVFYCPDTAESQSPCRKPIRECSSLSPSASTSPRSGTLRRRQPARPPAAAAVGAHPILVLSGKARRPARPASFRKGPPFIRIWRRGARAVPMTFLRSLVFLIAQILVTPSLRDRRARPLFLCRGFALSRDLRWSRTMIWLAKNVLGIHYRVIGMENLPRTPGVILSKHQSAWETWPSRSFSPPQCWC